MLEAYKKKYAKETLQLLVVDKEGTILETDDVLFKNLLNKRISSIHPFFESLVDLLSLPNEEFLFSCVHLDINGTNLITDIILKTFDSKNPPLIIINDLTTHYTNYQLTAQVRNESVINSQILELKNEYLREKEEFKNSFIANFSHELREPLSGITTFTEILNKTNLTSEQKDYLNIINASNNNLKHMIDDILDISKIEVGKLKLVQESFNLRSLLEELVFTYKAKANQKGIEFMHNFKDNIPMEVDGDRFRLRQVLSNVLENAVKYTESGTITFNASLNQIRATKANINFEIIDTGIGIAEEHLDNVFYSFEQVTHDNSSKGTGLGLAIVKRIVELLDGRVSVESELNKGSIFSLNINFIMPLHKKEVKKAESQIIHDNSKKYNILLVENSDITQLSVLKLLAGRGNFFLDIVSKPEDVIPTIENSEIDLILMDINLPGITGDELTMQIRSMPEREHKRIPILALTGKIFPEDLRRYKKAKMNGYIKKPFNEKTLIDTIYKHLK